MGRVIKHSRGRRSAENIEYVVFDEELSPIDNEPGETPEEIAAKRIMAAQQKAEELLSEAKLMSEEIVQEAKAKADEIQEEAFRTGYEEGKAESSAEVYKAADSISKAFEAGLSDVASIKDNILKQAEPDIVRMATAIASKLVFRELKLHPDAIVDIAKETIKAVKNDGKITIKLHPDDRKTLEEHFSELTSDISSDSKLILEDDADISAGGCIVETDVSLIDASFEVRMAAVDQFLNDNPENGGDDQ